MVKTHRVEWIGARSPLEDDTISFKKMIGFYTDDIELALEAISNAVSPLIRQYGSTVRKKGPADGLSKHYQWGPRAFICDVDEIDVERLFKHPDHDEFRDLDNPDHDDRRPEIPWYFLTAKIEQVIREAENGPKLVLASRNTAMNDAQADSLIRKYQDRRGEAEERRLWEEKRGRR